MFSTRLHAVHILVLGLVIALSQPVISSAKVVSPDFVALSKKLNPTVVNIRTAKIIKPKQRNRRQQQQNPFQPFL
jgi:serine protease Do